MPKVHDPICIEADLSTLVPTDEGRSGNRYKVEPLCVCDILDRARGTFGGLVHDPFCQCFATGTCCSWIPNCDCQCMCDFIREIRADERSRYELSDEVCDHCGKQCSKRLPMPPDTEKIYNAIFGPGKILSWSENEDCGMNLLMYRIAEAAARALRVKD